MTPPVFGPFWSGSPRCSIRKSLDDPPAGRSCGDDLQHAHERLPLLPLILRPAVLPLSLPVDLQTRRDGASSLLLPPSCSRLLLAQQAGQRDTAGPLRPGRLLRRCRSLPARNGLLVTHQAGSSRRHFSGRQRSARARGGQRVASSPVAALPVLSTDVSSLLMGLCFASSDLTDRPAARQNARGER